MSAPQHTAWAALRDARCVDGLDAALAAFVAREAAQSAPEHADLVARTAALVSRERAAGHSCVFLDEWVGRRLDDDLETPRTEPFPDAATWRTALLATAPLAGDGTQATPLVVAEDRVYLHRFWSAEQRLAAALLARAVADPLAPEPSTFRAVFPPLTDEVDHQALAAAAVLHGRLAVLLGGPGTGKTTTVARMLAVFGTLHPDAQVALAAPTGKAAARLTDSLLGQLPDLPLPDVFRAHLQSTEARTIHRLLGYRPDDDSFRHDRHDPLGADLVIVDEASMIDLELMHALVDAVRPGARLVLLGDPDQLASVATGHVLGDVLTAAAPEEGPGAGLVAFAAPLLGMVPTPRSTPAPLADHVVMLQKTWRFEGGIADLARAVRDGDVAGASAVLADSARADAQRATIDRALRDPGVADLLEDWLRGVVEAADPAEALRLLRHAQILCAVRAGPEGVATLNAAVEARLHGLGLLAAGSPARQPFYRGRPILVTANDPATGLYNGDVGVVWHAPGETARIWFPGADDAAPRSFGPGRLPPHETAWATTVHKSQGSEYDHVLLVLPERDSPVVTRELLYTGITRAKQSVLVSATDEALGRAITRRTRRVSGLARLLGNGGVNNSAGSSC